MCVGFLQGFFYPDIKKKVAQEQKKQKNPREHSVPSENIGKCVGKSILLNPHIFVLGVFGWCLGMSWYITVSFCL